MAAHLTRSEQAARILQVGSCHSTVRMCPFANKISYVNTDFTQTGWVAHSAPLPPGGRQIGKILLDSTEPVRCERAAWSESANRVSLSSNSFNAGGKKIHASYASGIQRLAGIVSSNCATFAATLRDATVMEKAAC